MIPRDETDIQNVYIDRYIDTSIQQYKTTINQDYKISSVQQTHTSSNPNPQKRKATHTSQPFLLLLLSPQDAISFLPAKPFPIPSSALRVRRGDGVAVFDLGGLAGGFGELAAVQVGVGFFVGGDGLPAVADVVVGRSLGFGDGDDVVVLYGFGLGELAFFWGCDFGEFGLLGGEGGFC